MRLGKRNYIFAVISVVLMMIIFWFSSRDATQSTEQSDFFITVFLHRLFDGEIPHWLSVLVRKLAHFTAYAALGFSLYYTFSGAVHGGGRTFLYALSTTVAYAVSDEIHQMFVPGRAGRIFDLFVDTCGALFGIGIGMALLYLTHLIKERRACR